MASSTQYCYCHIVNDFLIPKWGAQFAVDIKPLRAEEWLHSLSKKQNEDGLAWTTLSKIKYVFTAIYQLAEKKEKMPADGLYIKYRDHVEISTETDYEAVIITPAQTFSILTQMPLLERTMTLLVAVTGLRYSEVAGLQWQDIRWDEGTILVRRTWKDGVIGPPKTKKSKAAIPMAPGLSEYLQAWQRETNYSRPTDWIFASDRAKGRTPRVGGMLAADYLRPAAIAAGVQLTEGQRFGFHNLRASLSTFLITEQKADVRTTQDILRHSKPDMTLAAYTQSSMVKRVAAQQTMLDAILSPAAAN